MKSQSMMKRTAPASSPLIALEQIRRMRGGAQSHLMRCLDGNYYVVKFANNPQGIDVLANEFLGGRIAELLGLSVSPGAVVYVDPKLVWLSEEMYILKLPDKIPCQAGLCFGSRFPIDLSKGRFIDFPDSVPTSYGVVHDILPDKFLGDVENVAEFLGMLVFDLWTCNSGGRQVVFVRKEPHLPYRAQMIDQGFCFRGYIEKFNALRSTYNRWRVYENVRSIDAFEPWLTLVEQIDEEALAAAAVGIPNCWYADNDALGNLLDRLYAERNKVRELLFSLRNVTGNLFPNWIDGSR